MYLQSLINANEFCKSADVFAIARRHYYLFLNYLFTMKLKNVTIL